MCCSGNSGREQGANLSFLSVNQNTILAFLDIPYLWTSFSISLQIALLKTQSQWWQILSLTMCTGLSLHLKSEVTACVKSCPALYNSLATFNMSHLATLRRGRYLYSKSVMECLPKMFAKLKKWSKAKI